MELRSSALHVQIEASQSGAFTWPVLRNDAVGEAFILPLFEGSFVPTNDKNWANFLENESPMDTTAGLNMPFFGVMHQEHTVTYVLVNEFNNKIEFIQAEHEQPVAARELKSVGVRFTQEFPPNNVDTAHEFMITIGDPSPVEPARQYRKFLIKRNKFISMRDKITRTPAAERLLGAPHIYVWGDELFCHLDVRQWKPFAKALRDAANDDDPSPRKRLAELFDDEARSAIDEVLTEQWPSKYAKSVITRQICESLRSKAIAIVVDEETSQADANKAWFVRSFGQFMTPSRSWGDGVSTKMIDQLHDAGLERALLLSGELASAAAKPQVAEHATKRGYLFGPYDSYHSIHHPSAHPDNTWETAQFDLELYKTGGILRSDGQPRKGFKQRGYLLSPHAAKPYVIDRVNHIMGKAPMSAWFIDCDAYGDVFDDYSPDHPSTQKQDADARCSRMAWIRDTHDAVIGSEGGSAYAAGTIHFAHGMMTPVIGWGDPDLKQRDSKFFLGAYWPPDGPRIFTRQVPLKPVYKKFFYDPRYRLPLYQIVFHDSVIATHHWGYHSLKFADQVETVALFEQLYNVPPMYHLNHEQWKKHRDHIIRHDAFFRPLHEKLAFQNMIDFKWLTDERLVQQTRFADGTVIIANFGEKPYALEADNGKFITINPRSAAAMTPDGRVMTYTP